MFAFVENYKKYKIIQQLEMMNVDTFFTNLSILKDVLNHKNKRYTCQILQMEEGQKARSKMIDFLSQCQYVLDYDMRFVKRFEKTSVAEELGKLVTADIIDALYPNGMSLNEYGSIPKIVRKKDIMQKCNIVQDDINDEDKLLDTILNHGCEELISAFHPYLLRKDRFSIVMQRLCNHYTKRIACCDDYECAVMKEALKAEQKSNELTCNFLNMLIENKYPTASEIFKEKDADKIGYMNWKQTIDREQEIV